MTQQTVITWMAANLTPAASRDGINVGSLMRLVKKNTDGATSAAVDDTESATRITIHHKCHIKLVHRLTLSQATKVESETRLEH